MANNNNGLMQPKDTASTTPITDKLKSMLSPASKTPLSLEDKLSNLSAITDAIDVSGALETNKVKDIIKIKNFITEVKKIHYEN